MGARTCLATSNVIGRRMALSFNLVCPFQIKKKENKAHGVWTLPSLTKKTLDNILNRTFPGTSKGREREEERAGCNEFCSYGGSLDSEGSASQSRALPRLSSARLPMRSSVASVNTPPCAYDSHTPPGCWRPCATSPAGAACAWTGPVARGTLSAAQSVTRGLWHTC